MIRTPTARSQDAATNSLTASNAQTEPSIASAPITYVYVAINPKNSSTNEIAAYAVSASGTLSAIKGSPFSEDVLSMAVNGKYLFASSRSTQEIHSFSIEPDGALQYTASMNYAKYNDPGRECGAAGQIFLDHSGTTLYAQEFDASSACANTVIASFQVAQSTGALTYLGLANVGAFPGISLAAYFIGNNLYAYTANQSACMYYDIYGFKRSANGLLSNLNAQTGERPVPPDNVRLYAPYQVAADPANHVAITMQPANPPGCAPGPVQLATYTAAPDGSLTTTSNYRNMPPTLIATVNDMKMEPTGAVLAVGGQEGLQLFRFNGARPITHYTDLLTHDPINQMFWDNDHHLYAISQTANKLFVFTISASQYWQDKGSPYTISNPKNIIVQPLRK